MPKDTKKSITKIIFDHFHPLAYSGIWQFNGIRFTSYTLLITRNIVIRMTEHGDRIPKKYDSVEELSRCIKSTFVSLKRLQNVRYLR